jgi:hypothetical protein
MGTTLQAVIEPVYIIIHTDREVQIEWREEIGINRLVITLVTMRKLSLANQLEVCGQSVAGYAVRTG